MRRSGDDRIGSQDDWTGGHDERTARHEQLTRSRLVWQGGGEADHDRDRLGTEGQRCELEQKELVRWKEMQKDLCCWLLERSC